MLMRAEGRRAVGKVWLESEAARKQEMAGWAVSTTGAMLSGETFC